MPPNWVDVVSGALILSGVGMGRHCRVREKRSGVEQEVKWTEPQHISRRGHPMPIVRTFAARLSLRTLLPIANSMGAHAAAKLGQFASDERTLTDDICDMFFIWAGQAGPTSIASAERQVLNTLPERAFEVTITKTSQREEATVGADFAIKVVTPNGAKRALIQAKVFDPQDQQLRCDSPAGWDKLWSQLVLMRQRSPLSFLLIYVPAGELNGQDQGVATWEQGYGVPPGSATSSKFGITLIPVEDLLDYNNNWLNSPPVMHVGDGHFRPSGLSIAKLLLEMLVCKRGSWIPPTDFPDDGSGPISKKQEGFPVHFRPYRELSVGFGDVEQEEWNGMMEELSRLLDEIDLT